MHEDHPSVWNSLGLLALGLVMLGFGADFFVDGAVSIAQAFSIPEALISLTLIALGTSLPELATTIVASIKGRGDIAVGNAIGSSIFNIMAILGITSIIEPLSRGNISWIDLGSMTLISIVLLPMLYTKNTLSRAEGGILLATYFAYIGYLSTRM